MDMNKDERNMIDVKAEILSWVKTIVFAVILALIITRLIIVNASIPSGSMENSIMTHDRVIAFRLSYVFFKPERYDIIVFRFPDDGKTPYVKRIIGLPGETVEIKDGKVYINGNTEPLLDDFIKETQITEPYVIYEVPEDCYFVLGDNRNASHDSRGWMNKFVPKSEILGKVIFRYFPFNKMRLY